MSPMARNAWLPGPLGGVTSSASLLGLWGAAAVELPKVTALPNDMSADPAHSPQPAGAETPAGLEAEDW